MTALEKFLERLESENGIAPGSDIEITLKMIRVMAEALKRLTTEAGLPGSQSLAEDALSKSDEFAEEAMK